MDRDIEGRKPIADDPLDILRLQIGEGGEIAVAKREPVVIVPNVEDLTEPLRIAIDEAEVAPIGTSTNPGWLEGEPDRIVEVVGAGRITYGRSPGFTRPYFSRASCSISESVLSFLASRSMRAFSVWSSSSCARALLVVSR